MTFLGPQTSDKHQRGLPYHGCIPTCLSAHGMSLGNFVRRPSAANAEIIVSRCMICGVIVAASPSQNKLQIAERSHRCK
jgi:hypothetical protein